MNRKLWSFLAGACFASGLFAQGSFIKDSLDLYINREMKRWKLPGLTLAVVKDGKVILMKGYGYADLESKQAATEQTVFQIASNSKAFTGTSLALLAHYKKLGLNDKVKSYLPYFNMSEAWRTAQISIADVLTHRIGYETFQTDLINWGSTRSRKSLIENMANVTPKFGLRETYGYCNMGYLVAGEIIPAVTDTSWDDYISYHYFKPLNMTQSHTTYQGFMATAKQQRSKAYTLANETVTEIVPANVDNLAPAAGISSSVGDLSHWLLMQLANGKYEGRQVIPEEVIARTRESFFIERPSGRKGNNFNNYGLGWFLKDAYGKKVVTHDGGANGFLSKTVLIPEEQAGFVILTNSDAQYLYEALGRQLTDDLLGRPYVNYSAQYYRYFEDSHREEMEEIAKLKKQAAAYKPAKGAYAGLSGVYTNPVYGKIAVEGRRGEAIVRFEYHPGYEGKVRLLSDTTAMIEYSDPSMGTHGIQYSAKELEIKVSPSIDMDPYRFTKISSTYQPFPFQGGGSAEK